MKAVVGENDFYMFVNEQPKGGFKWEFLDYKPEDDHNYRPIYIRLKPAEEAIEYWKQKYLEARQSGYEEGMEEGYREAVEAIRSKSNGSPDNEMDLSYASYLESRKRP
jgi:hypothetical protein